MNNDEFYDSLSIEILEDFAEKTFGKDLPSDVERLLKLLNSHSKVLEIGCGTGRIGIELIKDGFEYFGIDKQKKYLDLFLEKINRKKLGNKDFELINKSFEEFDFDNKFKFILFSWTVIGDFSKEEQLLAIKKTYRLLLKDGICILENPAKGETYNELNLYNPTPFYYEDWKKELTKIGFSHYSKEYFTKTGVKRELTILKKI
ncbi:class I SAM-dependent methyltransferase [archaeon]|jgi:ubiquinone/menaquinone biosynthesis C-methylase UbiE|nr:class I SAM-dependent methyltransferase [archaeon]